MTDKLFIDVSMHNVGEAIYQNGVYQKTIIHDFDWNKAKAQGVDGAIIKAIEGNYKDPAFDTVMKSCSLAYKGPYAFVDYTKQHYQVGKEVEKGKKDAQFLLATASKYPYNVRAALDFEQNAKWEPLSNTNSDQALNRALKIVLAMATEIYRLAGYWPIIYTNRWLTTTMNKNFLGCPLWIATGTESKPKFSNWGDYAIHQFSWNGDGKVLGNYTGNPWVDLNHVPDVNKILVSGIPTPPMEDEPVRYATVISWPRGVAVRSSAGVKPDNKIGALPYSLTLRYAVIATEKDVYGNLWVRVPQGWICSRWGLFTLVKIS